MKGGLYACLVSASAVRVRGRGRSGLGPVRYLPRHGLGGRAGLRPDHGGDGLAMPAAADTGGESDRLGVADGTPSLFPGLFRGPGRPVRERPGLAVERSAGQVRQLHRDGLDAERTGVRRVGDAHRGTRDHAADVQRLVP